MDAKRIKKLRAIISQLRGSDVRPDKLISLAKAIGRIQSNRGKHPTYVGGPPGTMPISIPHHATVKRFTAGSILDQLEQDLDLLEESDASKQKGREKKP
jgi:hypothetical protein